MHLPLVWLTVLSLCSSIAHGGKVLVFPVDGSHWVNMKVIIEELHARGHHVSVVRPHNSWYIKETSPHYTSITLVFGEVDAKMEDYMKAFLSRVLEIQRQGNSDWTRIKLELEFGVELHKHHCRMLEHIFENEGLMQSLQDAKYDLVLADPVVPGGAILAHYLSLPLVFNVRWTSHGEGHFIIAPSPLSYVPLPGLFASNKMTFLQRVHNTLVSAGTKMHREMNVASYYSRLLEKYLGPDVDFASLLEAADIWLMRVDFVFEFPRPTMPNAIYMGGFQCKPAKPLPQHLGEFVQASGEHGVVLMSLGTIFGELPRDIAEEIAAAFAQLPQKVIWRHKGDRPATLGNNTLLVDWMPQNDLLGHAKTRAFVAHGGTNGIYEAIYHGVPILGLPLFFDQPENLFRMEVRGAAKIMNIFTMTKDTFLQGIEEVLHEPSYRMNMQRLSVLHRDQPIKPLDSAIFWLEFVMRHKGAAHLRTESYKMPWYSYHSVDVILFLIVLVLVVLLTVVAFVKCLCCRVCGRKIKSD